MSTNQLTVVNQDKKEIVNEVGKPQDGNMEAHSKYTILPSRCSVTAMKNLVCDCHGRMAVINFVHLRTPIGESGAHINGPAKSYKL